MASASATTRASRSNASRTAATTAPGWPTRSISALDAFSRRDTREPGVPAAFTVRIPWCSSSSIPSPADASDGTMDARRLRGSGSGERNAKDVVLFDDGSEGGE